MDVQTQPRGARFFSILNDNDSPSFAVRPKRFASAPSPNSSSPTLSSTSSSPRLSKHERPNFLRQEKYTRASSFSSTTSSTPPLVRLSSTSSKSSTSSMDSSPSPITPAYSLNDPNLLPYDPMMRHDLVGYLPSPTTITPFLEQQMLLATPALPDQFSKPIPQSLAPLHYPTSPLTVLPNRQQIPTPVSSNPSLPPTTLPASTMPSAASNVQAKNATSAPTPASGKKNKYPCPYAQTHNCRSTFTTSGHAARHGKKHTGEKGVHCPVCNKAFTRKDNMKQHERTHKGSNSESTSDDTSARRSKAAVTKDAQKSKQINDAETQVHHNSRRSSLIRSPLSEVTSLAQTSTEPSLKLDESMISNLYPDSRQVMMPMGVMPDVLSPNSLYPNVTDELIMSQQPVMPQMMVDKSSQYGLGAPMLAPQLTRGFSDLDALAHAAESYNPYYQPPNM